MAAKKKTEEKKVNFKEFKYSGKVFEYSGRVYPKSEGKGKVVARYGINLTLNDVISIKGVYLVETEDKYFLTFPQYKSGDSYKSYIYIAEGLNEEIDNLTNEIVKCIE
jgi:DNA-binding cell septation regulator SpoVG